jgi:hypothetical protein
MNTEPKGGTPMRERALTRILLIVLAAMTAASSAEAATRRFTALLDLSQTGPPEPSPRCAAPTVLLSLEGGGTASRIGRVTAAGSHCIVDDPADPNFTDGELTLTSADGELFLTYSGTDVAGDLEGTFTITGGTGAFAGASGEGTLSGTALPGEERGIVLLRGRLTLP